MMSIDIKRSLAKESNSNIVEESNLNNQQTISRSFNMKRNNSGIIEESIVISGEGSGVSNSHTSSSIIPPPKTNNNVLKVETEK